MYQYICLLDIIGDALNAVGEMLSSFVGIILDAIYGLVRDPINDFIFSIYQASSGGSEWISKLNDLDLSLYEDLFKMSKIVFNALVVVGVGLSLIYWLFGIIDKLTKDRLNSYALIRSFIELTVAIVFINVGYDIIKTMANVSNLKLASGQTLFDVISGTITSSSAVLNKTEVGKVFNLTGGLLGGLLGIILALVYFLISTLVYAIFCTVIIARAVQVSIYIAMAPLAIANVYNRGSILESSAMSYFKKIIALSLQGPIICMILIGSSKLEVGGVNLINGTSTGGVPIVGDIASSIMGLVILIAVKFVSISLVMKSSQFANDIIA